MAHRFSPSTVTCTIVRTARQSMVVRLVLIAVLIATMLPGLGLALAEPTLAQDRDPNPATRDVDRDPSPAPSTAPRDVPENREPRDIPVEQPTAPDVPAPVPSAEAPASVPSAIESQRPDRTPRTDDLAQSPSPSATFERPTVTRNRTATTSSASPSADPSGEDARLSAQAVTGTLTVTVTQDGQTPVAYTYTGPGATTNILPATINVAVNKPVQVAITLSGTVCTVNDLQLKSVQITTNGGAITGNPSSDLCQGGTGPDHTYTLTGSQTEECPP